MQVNSKSSGDADRSRHSQTDGGSAPSPDSDRSGEPKAHSEPGPYQDAESNTAAELARPGAVARRLLAPSVLLQAGRGWLAHEDSRIGAAMAFYTVFSLAPILLISTAIAGLVFGRDAVQNRIVEQMQGLLGPEGARLIQDMISSAWRADHAGTAALISVVLLLFGASAVFAELSTAFERIWGKSRIYGNAVMTFLLLRLRGLMVVIGIGFLLLTSLLASTLLLAFSDYLSFIYGPLWIVGSIAQALLSIAFITGLFILLTRPLIPVDIPLSLSAVSALLAAILFEIGKTGVSFYLGQSAVASSFGAAGSLAALLVWIFYVAQLVLFSAEHTAAAWRALANPAHVPDSPRPPASTLYTGKVKNDPSAHRR